jgi:hypothetical protein
MIGIVDHIRRIKLFLLLAALCPNSRAAEAVNNLPAGAGRIVLVENPKATQAFIPQESVVGDMVRKGLLALTEKNSTSGAWASLLSSNDIVGIKVYSGPGRNSGTRIPVIVALVETLLEAGIPTQHILIWDRRLSDLRQAGYFELAEKYGVKVAGSLEEGYDETVFYETPLLGKLVYGDLEFGKKGETVGRKSFVSKLVTSKMTKIINVTPLLNHNLAGVSGILYSLAMGSVDNVLRFELDPERLSNAIPEIIALPQLGDRVVLNIVDALICQYQGEERTLLHYSAALNQLWFSKDPVALDVLGITELERQRKKANNPEARINWGIYNNAAVLDLGVADPKKIQIERVK